MSTSWGMTRGQFKRRLKKARRASKRLANDRSQPAGSNAASRAARPIDGTERWRGAEAELRTLIGRNG